MTSTLLKLKSYLGATPADVDLVNPIQTTEVQYITDYFAQNGGAQKPEICLANIPTGKTVNDLIAQVESAIATPISPLLVNRFLYEMAANIKIRLTEKWESFGITIGDIGDEITPQDLVRVKDMNKDVPWIQTNIPSTHIHKWMNVGMLLAMHRVGIAKSIGITTYTKSVIARINDVLSVAPFNMGKSKLTEDLSYLALDVNFSKIAAMYDMFMQKARESEYSRLAVCTIHSYDRNGQAVGYLSSLSRYLKMEPINAAKFIFDRNACEDLLRVAKEGEEIEFPYSYQHYMVDFGLTIRSPYSAGVNPDLHHYVMFVGAMCQVTRCRHARILSEDNLYSFARYASFIAYLRGSSADGHIWLESREEHDRKKAAKDALEQELQGLGGAPDLSTEDREVDWSAESIVEQVNNPNSPYNSRINKYGFRSTAQWTNLRPTTAGLWLQQFFKAYSDNLEDIDNVDSY